MEFNSGPTLFAPSEDDSSFFRNGSSYFVDGAVGSDGFDGTRNNPFETIGRAIMQSQQDSGPNSVVIAPGNYNENLIVNDFGGLLMRGEGSSPHDVVVNGNDLGAGLKIAGGSEIELQNMSFKHATNGIYAENADLLQLSNVVARGNSKHGLRSNNIGNVYVSRSNFLQNGYSGAKISRSETIEIGHAMFAQNADSGLSLRHNASIKVNAITANENGVIDGNGSPPGLMIGDGDSGLSAFHNDQLEIRASAFMNNRENGIDLQSNHDVSLLYLEATANGQNGFRGGDNQDVFVRNGKYNNNMNGDGINLLAPGVIVDPPDSFERQNGISSVRVEGSRLWDNSRMGFAEFGYDEVYLSRLNIQRSGVDGVNVFGGENVMLDRVRSTDNGDDGFDVGLVGNLTTRHLFSESNGGNGIYVPFVREMVNINHGNFHHNGVHGIWIDGESVIPSNRVNVRHARAKENGASGLSIDDTNYGAIVGGVFSNNGFNGVELFDAGRFKLEHVNAKSNYFDGLFSGFANFDDRIKPGNENGDGPTLRGSLDIKQSSFNSNQSNGISIAGIGVASNNGGPRIGDGTADYYFSVNLDRVFAERNSLHGVFFGDDGIILDPVESFDTGPIARESGSATNVRFEANFNKGWFRHNGLDGIHADTRGSFLGGFGFNLDADILLDRITANHNGGNGFYSDFSRLFAPFPVPVGTESSPFAGNHADIRYYVDHGSFIRNGGDGISVFGPRTPRGSGDESQPEFFAEGVSSIRNGGSGLSFHTERNFSFDPPVPTPGTESGGGYESDLVARIYGGAFNHNGYDGIDISIDTDQAYGGDVGSLVVVERAIAKRNGQNGLNISGEGLITDDEGISQLGINADIIRGVFNRNEQDGVHLRNLGDVFLDNPTGVANRDDGFEGSNIVNVFGDWTFVANGDQDFVLN